MRFSEREKKELIIFALVAYGVSYVLGLLMWYGNGIGADLSTFPNAQMLYPAAGVMLAYLIVPRGDEKMPKVFFIFYIAVTALLLICSVASVLLPQNLAASEMEISVWLLSVQLLLILGSIVFWILLLASGKERRQAYGLCGKNWKTSFLCILLFFLLYSLRMGISYAIGGQIGEFAELWVSPSTWIYLVTIVFNFFLVVIAFFGEEYGWRYYLQPLLQKRFGLRGGVLLLGLLWGLWHLPLDFFYYTSPDMGMIYLISQIITCVFTGIFLAYTYMKTNNIWVAVAVHFLNNNLIPMFVGDYSSDVLQGQTVSWGDLPFSLVINLVIFGWFLFLKPFRNRETV